MEKKVKWKKNDLETTADGESFSAAIGVNYTEKQPV